MDSSMVAFITAYVQYKIYDTYILLNLLYYYQEIESFRNKQSIFT